MAGERLPPTRRLLQSLSIPLAKGILLTAGLLAFILAPIGAIVLIGTLGSLPGFWYGALAASLGWFALWWAWLIHYR